MSICKDSLKLWLLKEESFQKWFHGLSLDMLSSAFVHKIFSFGWNQRENYNCHDFWVLICCNYYICYF